MVTRKSSILGPDGRPIEVAVLSQELAEPTDHGIRRVIEDRQASGLTPERLARILRSAETGEARDYLTLAMEMEERYLHYASQLQTRRLAVEGIEPTVNAPDGVPAKIVDLVTELVEGSKFADLAGDLTDGVGKGYAAVETMWEYERRALRPVELKWRDPRFFVFDRLSLSEMRLATDAQPFEGEELPPYKFVRHLPRTRVGIPMRRGLARPAAWAFLIQSFGLKDWAAFAEVYGVPLRLGRYGPNASEADKRSLLRAVRMISNDGAAIAPTGMEIEFVKVEGQHGAAVFGELIDYVDANVSKLVLGQTMTSDDGSSLAQAQIHNEVRLDIAKADARQLAQTINRDLIEPFVAFNFGPQDAYPQVDFPVTEPEDTKALTENVARLVPMGFRVSQKDLRDRLGLPEPGADEDLLTPPAQPAPPDPAGGAPVPEPPKKRPRKEPATTRLHVTGCQCASCLAQLSAEPAGAPDELDRLADEALADWIDITDPMLGPLQAILANAKTLEEARTMLAAAQTDPTALAEALAELTAVARGLGDTADDLPEG